LKAKEHLSEPCLPAGRHDF